MIILFNLIFDTTEKFKCFKTHVIRRARASVSAIMYELGKKSKNYYRMRDMSFWKMHDELKDEINKKPVNVSRRSRKKRKLNPNSIPNGLIYSSLRLSISFNHKTTVFLNFLPLFQNVILKLD